MEFLLADGNLPFAVALSVMLALTGIEGVLLLVGGAASDLLDGWLDKLELFGLKVGKMPALVALILFLTSFGLSGYVIQALGPWPVIPVSGAALVTAVVSLRVLGGFVARVLPRDETEAVTRESFVGRTATITVGTARHGAPAEARLKDEHGHTHYVMVQPETADETFPTGTRVVLVAFGGAAFFGRRDPLQS